MPRGGQKSCQGGRITKGGGIFARASRAQSKRFFPLANISSTSLFYGVTLSSSLYIDIRFSLILAYLAETMCFLILASLHGYKLFIKPCLLKRYRVFLKTYFST